jgi:ABC-type glycerol-3-phosphate transport system substrate-binding protein
MQIVGKIKLISLLAAVLLLSSACGSSGSSGSASVVLNFWGTFESSDNIAPFIQAYQQLHPNVQINYTEKNYDTYEQDLLNALASGSGPDIFAIHNDWLPKYQDKLVDAPVKLITLKDYNNAFLDVVTNDFVSGGKIYAMPISVDSLGLYYNKDILGSVGIATPPKTWEEMRKDVKLITRSNSAGFFTRSGVAMGTTNNINRAVDIMYLLMLQNHNPYYTADYSQSTLDQAVQDSSGNTSFPAASALNFYTNFSNPGSDAYTWNQNSNYSIDAFANGQLAFMYGYSYTRDAIVQKSPNLNFDVTTVPQPNLTQNPVNFANYWGQGVSKLSKNSDWAWDFVKFMATKNNLTSYYTRHKLPSSRRDIIADQSSDPIIGTFAYANLTAKSFYKKDQVKVDNIITSMISNVIVGGKSVSESLSNAAQQINLLNASQ